MEWFAILSAYHSNGSSDSRLHCYIDGRINFPREPLARRNHGITQHTRPALNRWNFWFLFRKLYSKLKLRYAQFLNFDRSLFVLGRTIVADSDGQRLIQRVAELVQRSTRAIPNFAL